MVVVPPPQALPSIIVSPCYHNAFLFALPSFHCCCCFRMCSASTPVIVSIANTRCTSVDQFHLSYCPINGGTSLTITGVKFSGATLANNICGSLNINSPFNTQIICTLNNQNNNAIIDV